MHLDFHLHLYVFVVTIFPIFSLYDIRPSENDLLDHLSFISEAVKRDETLRKSEVCLAILGVLDVYICMETHLNI